MLPNVFDFVINLVPVPASRPRVGKFGTYYSKRYDDWKNSATKFVPTGTEPTVEPVAVTLEVVCKRPAKPTKAFPQGDVDNLAKGPLDVITQAGTVWVDDTQVTQLTVRKRYAYPGEEPHTRVQVFVGVPMQ